MDENSPPYKIHPHVHFNLESLPVFGTNERIDFFYKYRRAGENLYIGNIDKKDLELKHSKPLFDSLERYFDRTHYKINPLAIVKDFDKRLFPKVCWLTDSFFKIGFKYPVCVHYNPRIQQNVIHPGSIRNHVIKLFQETNLVNCLYFNTGGVEFDFMKDLKVLTKEELLKFNKNLEIELVADHCSIIPHINVGQDSVSSNIETWQEFIYRRLTSPSFTVFTNASIQLLEPWYTDKSQANIEIEINDVTPADNEWLDILCKCLILVIIGKSYKSKSLTVTHKITFDTP